jgi:hypothetical protein
MNGVVPPGGHQLGDTISRRKFEDGEELPCDCVVFVGDSDIEYWGDSGWNDEFEDCVNIGMGGATIREAARHVVNMVETLRPKYFWKDRTPIQSLGKNLSHQLLSLSIKLVLQT